MKKVRQLKDLWYPHVKSKAMDLGMMGGHSDYVKFIILGRSRTGSNFLLGLLNAHKQIIAYGEILKSYVSIDWSQMDYRPSKRTINLYDNDPVRFLSTRVFRKYPKQISAVGFKLFYYHAQEDGRKSIWTFLGEQKEIRVIHIKRKNMLKTHLSKQRADRTDTWVNVSGSKGENISIALNYEDCLADFIQTRDWERQYDGFFANHPIMEIFYEDLSNDYANEMKRIEGFLGVPYEPVKPQTYKQSNKTLAGSITNYYELKEKFKGSPWEEFFIE